jgi:hypothetical protein
MFACQMENARASTRVMHTIGMLKATQARCTSSPPPLPYRIPIGGASHIRPIRAPANNPGP